MRRTERQLRLGTPALLLLGSALPILAGTADASIPAGNLIRNPGAEAGSGSGTGLAVLKPDGWERNPMFSPRATVVRYGAPDFPTAAQGAALGGGRNFFAGGPTTTDGKDNDSSAYSYADLVQYVSLPGSATPEISAGQVQATLSACLGGYRDQDDRSNVYLSFFDGGGKLLPGGVTLGGPDARSRGDKTTLEPGGITRPVDRKATTARVTLTFIRKSGKGTYNDGYADNLSLNLSRNGTFVPEPTCTARAGNGHAPGVSTPTGGPVGHVLRLGHGGTLVGKRVVLALRCLRHDSRCNGRLRLTIRQRVRHAGKGKKRTRQVTIGRAGYSIPARAKKNVAVRLNRKGRVRLVPLSRKRLRRLHLTAVMRLGSETVRTGLRLRRGRQGHRSHQRQRERT